MSVTDQSTLFVDRREHPGRENRLWPAYVARGANIAEKVGALAEGEPAADGRRELLVVHPESVEPGLGLAPGIEVAFGLLLPNEQTRSRRHNASQITMVLSGTASVTVGSRSFSARRRDVWNTPSMNIETLRNDGPDELRYLTYSSAAMLRKLEIYFRELDPPQPESDFEPETDTANGKEIAGAGVTIGDDGSQLLPYEYLVDPGFVESRPHLWRWEEIEPNLAHVRDIGPGYTGRHLWVLYNPATGDRYGTTFCFFASVASSPPGKRGPNHRHTSAAINFILDGSGFSEVGGDRIEWSAGDIMLSAPGWSPHAHNTDEGSLVLTVQDHPLQIGAEALVWEEHGEIRALGTQAGFDTNLAELRAAR